MPRQPVAKVGGFGLDRIDRVPFTGRHGDGQEAGRAVADVDSTAGDGVHRELRSSSRPNRPTDRVLNSRRPIHERRRHAPESTGPIRPVPRASPLRGRTSPNRAERRLDRIPLFDIVHLLSSRLPARIMLRRSLHARASSRNPTAGRPGDSACFRLHRPGAPASIAYSDRCSQRDAATGSCVQRTVAPPTPPDRGFGPRP